MYFILVPSLNVSCGKQVVFSWCLVPVLGTLWCFLWLVLLLYNGCDLSSVIHLTWCVRWCPGEFFLMFRLLKELWSTSLSMCLICRQLTTRVRSKDFVFLLQCLTGKSCPSILTSLQMLLCRSGSTFFFPVPVLLIPRDFLHVVLTLFVSARCVWDRWIDS